MRQPNQTKQLPATVKADLQLAAGRYAGSLVLDEVRVEVLGAGEGLTVIEGDLVVASQCRVRGLTVLGDVVFSGNNARVWAECEGELLDYGHYNQFHQRR